MTGKMDSRYRSIVKTVSWRLIATLITSTIAYVLTGSLFIATSIGVLDAIAKTLLYYFHERAWQKVKWGKVFEKRGGSK